MAKITRWIPQTNVLRNEVLDVAKTEKDSLPVAENIFSAATTARLDVIEPAFDAALEAVANQKAVSINATREKEKKAKHMETYNSHFIQVFNFGVVRNKYPEADRAYYSIDVEKGLLPEMITDEQIKVVAEHIAEGEAARVAAGGVPMENPSAAEVAAQYTLFTAAITTAKNAAKLLEKKQQEVDALIPEADGVIKKVYDEAEAFYNEQEEGAMRDNCRRWGVIYINIGDETTVTVTVLDADGKPAAGADVKLVEAAGKQLLTNADGVAVFVTRVVGDARLLVTVPGVVKPIEKAIVIKEGEPLAVTVVVGV